MNVKIKIFVSLANILTIKMFFFFFKWPIEIVCNVVSATEFVVYFASYAFLSERKPTCKIDPLKPFDLS